MRRADRSLISVSNWNRSSAAVPRSDDELAIVAAIIPAARVLGLAQPKVSALRNYRLTGFSLERLMTLLTALDKDIEIVIRQKPRSRRAARISVVAA
jgi:hypothetical protein